MIKHLPALLVSSIIVLLAASCGDGDGHRLTVADQPEDSEPMLFAKNHFRIICVSCHGTTGRGDGPVGKNLTPHPRSFGDPSWQDQTSDEHIENVILDGGMAYGLSPLMAANTVPRIEEDPKVLDALVKIIRSFRR